MAFYFAYGSNLDEERMLRRCPQCRRTTVAILRGQRLAFVGYSSTWGGGVATLVPDPPWRTPGVLYEVSDDDLVLLDRQEGVRLGVYRRDVVVVQTSDGTRERAQTYVHSETALLRPSVAYLDVLRAAYIRLNFDLEPLEEAVRATQVNEPL